MTTERVATMPTLPKRAADANKGDFGKVLVIAGGRGMAGAAALVGAGALRSGAGLVRVACPAEVQPTVAGFEPSYMTYPLPHDDDGLIDFDRARPVLERLIAQSTVLACGPGLGRSEGLQGLVRWLFEAEGPPLVLDADGLNNLAASGGSPSRPKRPVVVTPHPGEFARLTGSTVAEIQADREGRAAAFAAERGVTLILKGSPSIVTDGRRVYHNATGNPGMATGGTGDVLTGVVAALLGQGLGPFEAAQLGAYAHGLAGDIARDQNGEVGLIAGDVVDALADAFYHLGQ